MYRALADLVMRRALIDPTASALTYQDVTLTYGELATQIESAAAGLAHLELARSERVAVYLEKRVETVVALLATSYAGGAFVPINPVLKPRQVEHILRDSGAGIFITSRARISVLREHLDSLPELRRVVLVDGDSSESGYTAWDDITHDRDTRANLATPTIDEDLCAILYTSGSTGAPKGVALTQRNLLVGAESVNAYLGTTTTDVILSVLPLSFDAGLSQLTTGFAAGAHVVLMNYLLPRDVVRLCSQHGVTALTCVPPLWIQLADQNWGDAGRTIRYFANTGGRMPRMILQRLREVFPHAAPFLMYGLTEAFRSTYLDPRMVDERPDSIGKAIPNAEILVLRPDGSPCEPDEVGEIVHRGPQVALGYWNDPTRTAERFRPFPGVRGAWARKEFAVWSGDHARADTEGYLYFVGRADEMIKTSGYRVSPAEIEDRAMETGLVRDAVALGVSDDELGQRIVLVVAGANGIAFEVGALRTALRAELPGYMVPSQIIVHKEIPRGPNGKYDRTLIRRSLEEEDP